MEECFIPKQQSPPITTESHHSPKPFAPLQEVLPNDETLCDLSDFFKLFADSTRIKILCLLAEKEMCVCDIAESLNMTSSAISHQLKALRLNKLVKASRSGKEMLYSLADFHVSSILTQGLEHLEEP